MCHVGEARTSADPHNLILERLGFVLLSSKHQIEVEDDHIPSSGPSSMALLPDRISQDP